MRKIFAIIMIIIILNPIPYMSVSADRVTGELETKAESKADVNVNNSGGAGGPGGAGGSGSNGGGSGGPGGDGGDGGASSITVDVDAVAIVKNGREVELSAHLLESVQGLNRSTFVPQFSDIESDFLREYIHSSLTEKRFFGDNNKRNYVFNQDEKFDLEYVEALNWLYKNNLIQTFEDVAFKHTPHSGEEEDLESVAENTANGDQNQHTLDLSLKAGSYSLKYDMYGIPDKLAILDGSGKEIGSTGGMVSGQGEIKFKISKSGKTCSGETVKDEEDADMNGDSDGQPSGKDESEEETDGKGGKGTCKVQIVTNDGNGLDGTAWEYEVLVSSNNDYAIRDITDVALTEQKGKDSWLYPLVNDTNDKQIKKKDYIMQLMKVVDGLELSRPLIFESQYEYIDLDGARMRKVGVEKALNTIYKSAIGQTGIDLAINDVDVEFNKYGMGKVYVNPNVYELYLDKAYNSGIISKIEIKDEGFIEQMNLDEGFSYNSATWCLNESDNLGNNTNNVNVVGNNGANTNVNVTDDLLSKLPPCEDDDSEDNSDDKTVSYFKRIPQYLNNGIENILDTVSLTASAREGNNGGSYNDDSSNNATPVNPVPVNPVPINPASVNNAPTTPTQGNGDEEEELPKTKYSSEEDAELRLGEEVPNWNNNLPPVRVNFKRGIRVNGEYNADASVNPFGSSWSNPIEGHESANSQISGEFKYNSSYEYFVNEDVSYIEAVVYAYRALNAYADEKLNQREVDTIVSMYSVNYGNLNEEERTSLNYLIAKGIIDGDNSAKYTSIENITVKDAVVLTYRIANPSSRLTFKQVFGSLDEKMLGMNYAQSQVGISTYSNTLPEIEVETPKTVDYYVILNKKITTPNFRLGDIKFQPMNNSSIKTEERTYTHKELAELGLFLADGEYKVRIHKLPWNYTPKVLGYTTTRSTSQRPDWIDMDIGGGFYTIDEELLDGEYREVKFTRILPTYSTPKDGTVSGSPSGGTVVDPNDKDKDSKDETNDDNDPDDILSLLPNETVQMPKYMSTTFNDINELNKYIKGELFANTPSNLNDGTGGNKNNNGTTTTIPNNNNVTTNTKSTTEDKKVSVYIGVNEKSKPYLLFDGQKLFNGSNLNESLVAMFKDIKSIRKLDSVPKDASGQPLFDSKEKTFLEFTFPETNKRTATELKSLLKRRLTLTAEAEIANEDIASYTGLNNGQTMVSQKELARFGITSSKEEPDILYNEKTGTYAYLNVKDSYALIANTVLTVPKNSLMIEISADEIYYNIQVIMSMLNSEDFYIFNDEGKFEIVKKLDDFTERHILNPKTDAKQDITYTATVKSYEKEGSSKIVSKGRYINLSSVSNEPTTFFMSKNPNKGKRYLYGFEPYFTKSSLSKKQGTTANSVVTNLKLETSHVIYAENLLINNAILRQEFMIPKQETFVYVDNALKATTLTESKDHEKYAEEYLNFIKSIYTNLSVEDVKSHALVFKESNALFNNKNFKMTDLLDRSYYANNDDSNLKKLITGAKSKVDEEPFWVMYFLSRFSVTLPKEENMTEEQSRDKFVKALVDGYNKRYSFHSGWAPKDEKSLYLLAPSYISETDVMDKRLFNIRRAYKTPNKGLITTDGNIFVNRNDAVYMKMKDFQTSTNSAQPISFNSRWTEPNGKTNLIMNRYLSKNSDGSLTQNQIDELNYQNEILGTSFYSKNNNIYHQNKVQFKSLPTGLSPLELAPNGTKFTIDGEEYMLVNNMVTTSKGHVTAKIVRVNTTPLTDYSSINGQTSEERLIKVYQNDKVYKDSATKLGNYVTAVNKNAGNTERVLRSDEITSLLNGSAKTVFYLNTADKKPNVKYRYLTDIHLGKNSAHVMDALAKDVTSFSVAKNSNITNSKLAFNSDKIKIGNILSSNSIKTGPQNISNSNSYVTEYQVYDSYLIDYGTIAISADKKASLHLRDDYMLNSSPVMTNLVNELVKAVKADRIGIEQITVGDLVSGDELVVADGTSTTEKLTVIRTSTDAYKGHTHFISVHPMDNTITPIDLQYSGSVLLKNYNLLDANKISVNGERRSLYYFIGNRELNLAKPSDLKKYSTELEYPSLGSTKSVLVEVNSNNSGSKVETKKLVFDTSSTNTAISNASVENLTTNDKTASFNYFVSIYLDSNLLVKKNDLGIYEIIGYSTQNLVNTESFVSRTSRFEGAVRGLLTVLPTYSEVDGKFLGFDLSKLQVDSLKNIFNLRYWTDIIEYIVFNIEQVLSALGIYYIMMLMALMFLHRSAPEFFNRYMFDFVRLFTLGKLDPDNTQLRSFIPKCVLSVILLTLTYNGFIRLILLEAEEIRLLIVELLRYPFL